MEQLLRRFFKLSTPALICNVLCLSLFCLSLSAQDVPETPGQLIIKSIKNWNELYGTGTKALSWKYEGMIRTEKERQAALTEILNLQKAWMPGGDFTNPATVTAEKVSDDKSVSPADLSDWQKNVTSLIQMGHHKVRINWKKGLTEFTTLCITDDKTIVYDNMFYNTATFKHHSRCLDYHLGWIWQTEYEDMTRGAIWADLNVKCDDEGNPSCTNDCGGWMSAGSADCKCVVTKSGNCCRMEYTWAFACGFKKLKFKLDAKGVKFEVEVEGYLGSEGSGNGSCEECCPKKPKPVKKEPEKPVQTPGGSAGTSGPQKVSTTSVRTLSGEVIDVKVPNNIRPGDQITGSMETKSQSATLQGAVIDVDSKQTGMTDKLFKFIVPAGLVSIPFLIKDKGGATLASGEIPVNYPTIPSSGNNVTLSLQEAVTAPTHAPGNFAPMNYCQPGEPLTVNGFFDGDAATTRCTIGGKQVEIIAESPRGCFVKVPDNITGGQQMLKIEEQGVAESVPVQVITTSLTANKTLVQRNTKGKITLTVNNLEHVDLENNNFYVELTNNSPGVIQFRNTDSNALGWNLTSDNVRNGTFKTTVDVLGTAVGAYSVTSNLNSTTCSDCWKQYEACIAKVAEEEEACYKACDKANAGKACYLGCSTAARAQEIECFAEYLACIRKKLGF